MTRHHAGIAICLATLLAACGSSSSVDQNPQGCSATDAPSCGAHSVCVEGSGKAACACEDGYQDQDGDGACEPACTADTCGAHQACDDSSGTATCSCLSGYAGAGCEQCAAGFQDEDGDGSCAPACAEDTCGAHQTCDDSSGTAVCGCEPGHQDHDDDGTCEPACGEDTCGAHQICDDSTGAVTCACDLGYADDGAGSCAWSGILQDPGFDGAPPGAWTVAHGELSGSAAHFGFTGACTPGSQGVVSQAFALPEPSATGPLAVVFQASATCSGTTACPLYAPARLALEIGGQRVYTGNLKGTDTGYSLCLGEAAYQPDPVLSLLPADRDACQFAGVTYDITQADFAPDGDCPPLGSVTDGDLSGGGAGWTLSTNDPAGYARVDASGPIDGSPAAHLHLEQTCSQLSASVPLSVPLSGGTALHFDTQLTSGRRVEVKIDETLIGTVTGTGAPQSASVCLPSGLAGWVHTLKLTQTFPGNCADANLVDLYVDNLSLTQDPACDSDFIDPGLEADASASYLPWKLVSHFSGATVATRAPEQVHGGSQALLLENTQQCGDAQALLAVTLGAADATGGPALSFWFQNDTDGDLTDATVYDENQAISFRAPQAATWQKAVVCTPPERAGALTQLTFSNSANGSCGDPLGATEDFLIDDLQVTTDPSCPKD